MTILSRPRQPLSAYNLFFTLERKRILEGITSPITSEDVLRVSIENKKKQNVKRPHRKTHGKIGFSELAKIISGRWKKLDALSRSILDQQAKQEKLNYKKELQEWKAQQAALEAGSHHHENPTPTRPNEYEIQSLTTTVTAIGSSSGVFDQIPSSPLVCQQISALASLRGMIQDQIYRLSALNNFHPAPESVSSSCSEQEDQRNASPPTHFPEILQPLDWTSLNDDDESELGEWMDSHNLEDLFDW